MKAPTSTQPEVDPTLRIYGGGRKPKPIAGASNQPEVIPTKVHGVKTTRQVRVRMKGGDDKDGFLIRKQDFDEAKHERIE